jgi:hypothetical protein
MRRQLLRQRRRSGGFGADNTDAREILRGSHLPSMLTEKLHG